MAFFRFTIGFNWPITVQNKHTIEDGGHKSSYLILIKPVHVCKNIFGALLRTRIQRFFFLHFKNSWPGLKTFEFDTVPVWLLGLSLPTKVTNKLDNPYT